MAALQKHFVSNNNQLEVASRLRHMPSNLSAGSLIHTENAFEM